MSDDQDVRTFDGVQLGETVVVRALILPGESKAFVVVRRSDGRRTVWHDNIEKCTVDMFQWNWYLQLEGEADIRFDVFDPHNLLAFFKVPDTVVASDNVG